MIMESKVSSLEMPDFLYSCQAESQEKSRHLLTNFHTTPSSSFNNQSIDGEFWNFGVFFNPKIVLGYSIFCIGGILHMVQISLAFGYAASCFYRDL